MPFLDGKPVIITKRNTDKHGNPISIKQIETKQVSTIHNTIPLNYSIDRNHPIVITGFYQIYNQDEISDNTFFADYDQGILYFHSSQIGKSLTVTYMGTGYILISSNRIYRYSKVNGAQGNVSIESSFEKIENLLNTVIKDGNSLDATKAEVIAARTDADGKTYPSLGSRLDDMTSQLNNLNTILRYEKKIDIGTPTRTINIGITEYNPKTDIVNLYLSGVRMIEDVDFTVDRTNKTITSLKGDWINQDQIYIEVLQKMNDGRGSSGTVKIDSSNVVLTTPIFNSTDAQSAFVATEKNINLKADKTELTKYLPLAGGTITGNLTVNGSITGNSSSATKLKTARKINGVAFDGSQDITIGISSGSEIKLGGYSKPASTSAILVTDNLNTAIGKLEKGLEDKANVAHDHNSAKITAMTNYQKGTASAIQQTDSLNVAIGKLEATLDSKSNNGHTHNYAGSNIHNGAANSAVKLQTPRNITIGGTSNKFDGSSDITFTLAEIGVASTNHNQASNTITAMTGYTKGGTNGSIIPTDTLNEALSKIENNLDGKATTNHSHNYLPLSGGTITGNLTVNNGTITGVLNGNSSTSTKLQNARNINGVAFDGTKDITIGVTSGNQITLGGYTKPSSTSAITSADSLNAAIGKLEVGIGGKANASHNQASNTITTMTGYSKGTNSNAIATTDSLNQAIGKLEVNIGGKANINHNQSSNTITSMANYQKGNNTGAIAASDSLNIAIAKLENGLDGKSNTNHNHNNSYLSLTGGTVNGDLTVNGTLTANIAGNSTSATKLQTTRNIQIGNSIKQFDGSQNLNYTLNEIGAAAINHGRHIPNTCQSITDWNSAVTNGWYMANNATNAPTANTWYFGEVIAHSSNYVLQTVYAFTKNTDAKLINKYIRARMNGTWGAWAEVTVAKAVPSNAVFTDTWRGIQNNLTSDSATESLSAAQGKVLKGLVDGKANSNHTHNYLPLSGGTLTKDSFGVLTIKRSGSTNAAAIYFENGNGLLGAIGMNGTANGGVYRWSDDTSKSYLMLDTGNYKNTITPANIGAALSNHNHNGVYLPLTGGTINGSLTVSGGVVGNSTTATKLQTARNINLTGGVTGTVSFDGSKDVSMTTIVANVTSDKVTRMTGYSKASSVSAIQETDSLNVAIGKLEKAIESKSSTTISNVKLTETIVEKTIQANSSSVSIGQTINSNDIVRVYLDGVRLFEGKTYTLTKGANAQITMSTGSSLQNGDVVTFEIVRVVSA